MANEFLKGLSDQALANLMRDQQNSYLEVSREVDARKQHKIAVELENLKATCEMLHRTFADYDESWMYEIDRDGNHLYDDASSSHARWLNKTNDLVNDLTKQGITKPKEVLTALCNDFLTSPTPLWIWKAVFRKFS